MSAELFFIYAKFVEEVLGDKDSSHRLKVECNERMSSLSANLTNETRSLSTQSERLLEVSGDPVKKLNDNFIEKFWSCDKLQFKLLSVM